MIDLGEQRQGGVFLRSCDIIKKRLQDGIMKKEEFFQIAQFSYFPHKVSGINTNFRLFKHYDEHVMKFIIKQLPSLTE